MFTGDYIYQTIDWWHGIIPFPTSENPDEPYEHYGLLNSNILNLGLTIGLSDYWNISLSQLLVERCMESNQYAVALGAVNSKAKLFNLSDSSK